MPIGKDRDSERFKWTYGVCRNSMALLTAAEIGLSELIPASVWIVAATSTMSVAVTCNTLVQCRSKWSDKAQTTVIILHTVWHC